MTILSMSSDQNVFHAMLGKHIQKSLTLKHSANHLWYWYDHKGYEPYKVFSNDGTRLFFTS